MGALAVGLVTVGYGSRMVASEAPAPAAAVLPADLGRLIDEYLEKRGYIPEADLLLELTEVPAAPVPTPPEMPAPVDVPLSQAVPVPLRSRAEQVEVVDIPAQLDVAIEGTAPEVIGAVEEAVPEVAGAIEETAPEVVGAVTDLVDTAEPSPVVLLGSPAEESQETEELVPEPAPVAEESMTALVASEPQHESQECAPGICRVVKDGPAEVWGEPSVEIAEPDTSSALEYEPASMGVEPYAVVGVAGEY